ncbi:MAG: hypothetical protein ACM4AI_22945 [Acidobacteriota bacterium]
MSSTIAVALTVPNHHAPVRSRMAGLLAGLFLRAVAIGVGASALIVSSALALY